MMNERIRELLVEAREQTREGKWHAPTAVWAEKFAELIVQECINIGLEQKKWVEDMTVFSDRDVAWNNARFQQSQHIVDKIKEHFGVEE